MSWPETPHGGRLGDGRFAAATDRPGSIDALREAVVARVSQGHAIYPQGGGTALDYGGVPRAPGVAIDARSLSRVIDYPAADMTITVEAGITLSAVRATLAEQGQRLLIDAPHPDRATLGGIYATNTSGPRRFGAGRPRDQILGVSFVTSEGAVVKGGGRVVKNVAGYDFPRLLTGSMGTLGILVQMTLKVRPIPEASSLVWAPFPDAGDLGPALDRLNTSATRPMAIEVLNPAAACVVGEPMGLPAFGWALVVGFEDNAESVAWQVDRLIAELGRADVAVCRGEQRRPALVGPDRVPGGRGRAGHVRGQPAAVVGRRVRRGPRPVVLVRPVARGQRDRPGPRARGARAWTNWRPEIDRLRASAVRDGGNLTLSRCPTEWKDRLRVWGEPRADWSLAERVKRALDPKGVMNPGRFVGTI